MGVHTPNPIGDRLKRLGGHGKGASRCALVCFLMGGSSERVVPSLNLRSLRHGWGGWTRTSNLRGNNPMSLPVGPHPNCGVLLTALAVFAVAIGTVAVLAVAVFAIFAITVFATATALALVFVTLVVVVVVVVFTTHGCSPIGK